MSSLWKEENIILKNGLNVTVIYLKGTHSFASYIAAPIGALATSYTIDDKPTPSGIAHFLEHRLFDTPKGDAFELFTNLGCDSNAYTTYQYTTYYFETSSSLIKGIKILLGMTNELTFDDKSVEKEKPIIIEELHMGLDRPNSRLRNELYKNLFKVNPIKDEIVGSEESINKTTLEDLKRVFNVFYAKDKLRLFLIGDINQNILEQIGNIELKDSPSSYEIKKIVEEDEQIVSKEGVTYMDVPLPLITTGAKCLNIQKKLNLDNETYEALREVTSALLFSDSERLVKEMYKSGLISSPIYGNIQHVDNISVIQLSTSSFKIKAIQNKFIHFFEHIEEYVNKDSVERIIRYVKGSNLYILDDISSFSYLVVSNAMQGINYQKEIKALDSITYKMILAYLKEWKNVEVCTHVIKKESN